jgi:outer membrane protein assembly factor BamB
MLARIVQFMFVLVLAAALSACEPTPATDANPEAEIETAVEQIATAIVAGREDGPDPALPEVVDPGIPEFASPTPAEVFAPVVPETGATPLSTPTRTLTVPPTPTETLTLVPTETAAPATPPGTWTPTATVVTPRTPTVTPSFTTPTPEAPFVIAPGTIAGIPPEIAAEEAGWPMANRDYENSRAIQNAEIYANNVATMGIAWSFDLPNTTPAFAPAGNPLIIGEIVYYQDLQSSLYAFDLLSGSLIWQQMYDQPVSGPAGPGVGYGKLYAHVGSSLRALDLSSGEEIWQTELEGMGGSHQPYVFGELVLTSTRQMDSSADPDDQPQSGWFYGIQHETGQIVWQQPAVQDDIWGDTVANSRGGSWFSPAVDAVRGLSYWGTGKLVNLPEENEPSTLQDTEEGNIYSHSVAALTLETGVLEWAAQLDPTPRYGHGIEVPPLLITIGDEDEEPVDLVVGAGRAGRIMALNPDSGELIWDIQVGRQQNIQLEAAPVGRTIQIFPGLYGGIASPMAHADGIIYAAVNHLPVDFSLQELVDEVENDETGQLPAFPTTSLLDGSSELVAVDAATGAVLWTIELPRMNFGGITVINDLLFTSTIDGVVYAYERQFGTQVWIAQAPHGLLSPPAVAGDTIMMAAMGGERPFLFALRLGLITPATPAAGPMPTLTPTRTPQPTQTQTQPAVPPVAATPTPAGLPQPTPTEADPGEIIPPLPSPTPPESEP